MCSLPAWCQAKDDETKCADTASFSSEDILKKYNIQPSIFKYYCYGDQSGNYVIYLTGRQNRHFKNGTLSNFIAADVFKINKNGSLNSFFTIRDASSEYDAGLNFDIDLTEIRDIDSDGLIEPILVYRFFEMDKNTINTDAFSGRIKIVMFYKGKKIVIRATTGGLDDERSTTANKNFFLLPTLIQNHLVKKMTDMYKNNVFGFNNGYDFKPRKQKN